MKPAPGLSPRWRALAAFVAAILLALVFAAYLRPGFVLDMANRIGLCF